VQQQALRDFDRALAAFFRPGNPGGKPRYRTKRGPQGFVIRDTRVRRLTRRWGEVHVPKCGWVRFRWTRALPAHLGMARVSVDRAGRWHVAFPAPQPAASGAAVIYVDPRFTSQQCHVCGHTERGNRDSQAVFLCQRCGHGDHADVNVARNILARGLATMGVPAPAPGHGAHAHISRQQPLTPREPACNAA
jgi:transposase